MTTWCHNCDMDVMNTPVVQCDYIKRLPGVVTGAAVIVAGGWWGHIIRAVTTGKTNTTHFNSNRHWFAPQIHFKASLHCCWYFRYLIFKKYNGNQHSLVLNWLVSKVQLNNQLRNSAFTTLQTLSISDIKLQPKSHLLQRNVIFKFFSFWF